MTGDAPPVERWTPGRWRPMDGAARDGSRMHLLRAPGSYRPGRPNVVVGWHAGGLWLARDGDETVVVQPSGWQPAPPVETEAGDER